MKASSGFNSTLVLLKEISCQKVLYLPIGFNSTLVLLKEWTEMPYDTFQVSIPRWFY